MNYDREMRYLEKQNTTVDNAFPPHPTGKNRVCNLIVPVEANLNSWGECESERVREKAEFIIISVKNSKRTLIRSRINLLQEAEAIIYSYKYLPPLPSMVFVAMDPVSRVVLLEASLSMVYL